MPKPRKWIFVILAGSLVIGAVWFTMSEHQPSYQGRPLAYWLCLKNNDDDEAVRDLPHSEEAIRQMGTKCLPYLLCWIAYEPPTWKTKLFNVSSRLRWIPEGLQDDHAEQLAQGAVDALLILGHRASPAIPQLARLAKDSSRGMSAHRAAFVLISFGPETQAIVMDLLTDPRPLIRTPAIFEVARLGTNALPAIPRLIECLKDPDENVAATAARALGELQLRPELSVPALTNALQDGRFGVARSAEAALGEFGLAFHAVRDLRPFAGRYGNTNSFQKLVPRERTNDPPVRAD